jgi:hypothetical protein
MKGRQAADAEERLDKQMRRGKRQVASRYRQIGWINR